MQFINKIKSKVLELCKQYNILPSLMMAQACHESGFGKHAPGNNLFGYKWTKTCGYEYQLLWTKEYINGQYISVQAKFRKYDSTGESLEDYAKLIGEAKRYEPVRKCRNYICACQQIKACGYATGITYDISLRKIIEYYKLYELDWKMDFNKKLTENFKWGEFWSNSRSGIKIEPPEEYFNSIKEIARELQIVRDLINKPYPNKNKHKIIVVSGYRTPEWNKICGGANESYHMKGMAADTRASGMNIIKYALYILRFTKFNGIGLYRKKNFIHADLRKDFIIFKY